MRQNFVAYVVPALLALAVTVMLVLLLPEFSSEGVLRLMDSEETIPDHYMYFHDLDGDGESEELILYLNASGNLAVSVSNVHSVTLNQFNLPGRLTRLGSTLDIHDIDGNGVKDLFFCTEKNDSLFLTIIDRLFDQPTTTRQYFLDRINRHNDNGDYRYVAGDLSDLNGDGHPEYVMAINGGHSLQPRRVYAIDFHGGRVLRSPLSGAAVVGLDLFDLDDDGADEVLVHTVAPENFKEPIPFRDSVTWMMVLDNDLTFYRPPVPLDPAPSRIVLEPFIHEGSRYVLSLQRYREGGFYHSRVTIHDRDLRALSTRTFSEPGMRVGGLWRTPDSLSLDDIRVFGNRKVYTLDMNLQETDSVENRESFGYATASLLDLDHRGPGEYVCVTQFSLNVFRLDLKMTADMDIRWEERTPRVLLSTIEANQKEPILFAQVGRFRYRVDFEANPLYRFRWMVSVALFLLVFGFFYLLGSLQARIVRRRYEKDRIISKLRLQSIRNQLDPHFTYNALNAVGSLIYKGEKDRAYHYLKGLSDLLRMVSSDPGTATWTLTEEVSFVYKFLDIEKLRFRDQFNYSVETGPGTGECLIPKMSVLTFVENAIKHGLRHKESDRNLEVRSLKENGILYISVVDDGIGREAAERLSDLSVGKGIRMMDQYFSQFQRSTGHRASFRIRDLKDGSGGPAGTKVEIEIEPDPSFAGKAI